MRSNWVFAVTLILTGVALFLLVWTRNRVKKVLEEEAKTPRCHRNCEEIATHVFFGPLPDRSAFAGEPYYCYRCFYHAEQERQAGAEVFALNEVAGEPVSFWRWSCWQAQHQGSQDDGR